MDTLERNELVVSLFLLFLLTSKPRSFKMDNLKKVCRLDTKEIIGGV